jgi:membrane protease YdiL (CAAX protease family)
LQPEAAPAAGTAGIEGATAAAPVAAPAAAPVDAAPSTHPAARAGAHEALWAAAGLLALLWGGKHLARVTPWGDVIFTAIAAYQLYVPLWLIQRAGEVPESHGVHVHGLILGPLAAWRRRLVVARRLLPRGQRRGGDRLASFLAGYARGATFRPRALAADVARALAVALVVFPIFALLHHLWLIGMAELGHPVVRGAVRYQFRLPPELGALLLQNVFLIALPEELFYRGFLETRLGRLWPVRRFVLGIPLGRAVFVASALFALDHFLGEYNLARLGPFFPAFVFSALTRQSGSILGAMPFHGLSNAFSAFLFAGYLR